MKEFIAKFGDQINGILSGMDRLIFHGKLRALYNPGDGGLERYLKSAGGCSKTMVSLCSR